MVEHPLVEQIADKNVDIDAFVKAVWEDVTIREEVVRQLLTNSNIMVYYHCYYIISKASEEKPELFYQYWGDFVFLLDHKNSYHRDIGMTIIANLTRVDESNAFADVFQKYMEHFNDDKFMTAQCFVRNLKKILRNKQEYTTQIVHELLDIDNICTYPARQKALLKSDIIEVLDEVYERTAHQEIIAAFVRAQADSISPKTKKKVKAFLKKYNL